MAKLLKRFIRLIVFISAIILLSNLFFERNSSADGDIKVIENPKVSGYITVLKDESDIYTGELILVNNKIPYRFEEENSLISLYDVKNSAYKVKDTQVMLRDTITDSLNSLFKEFYEKFHTNSVIVISGYRSYDYQENLYNEKIAKDGEVEAAKWVAKPGGSEHHTGLALDLGIYYDNGISAEYSGIGKYKWINENAYKYGFIVRYPESKKDLTGINYEPWHFRYIGRPHSLVVVKNDMCLEEYIDYLRQFEFGIKHLLVTDCDGNQYEIYFTRELNVPVPKTKEYKISGNNIDGFIITISL